MGSKAPEHYFICDGAELSVTDYPALSGQIQDEFGTDNLTIKYTARPPNAAVLYCMKYM